MKKFYLCLAMFGCTIFGVSSQTILNEGFETGSVTNIDPNIAEGWTTLDTYAGNVDLYRWHNYYATKGTITGMHVAACDGPMANYSEDYVNAQGPREEILLSPELTLDNTYQLSFDWKAASASALNNKEYDLQIRIVEGGADPKSAATIWSFQNADQLKESGVSTFPWTGWEIYNSKIDLSPYQGKKVKIAFVYKMLKKTANVVYIDNVKVSQFTPINTPKASLSKKIYGFGDVIVGSKIRSEGITLKNEGAKGLTITDIEYPNGISSTIIKESVNLGKGESLVFNVIYNASLISTTDGNIVFRTSGGDVTLRITATKVALADGYTFEGFESGVPPTGWSGNGWNASYPLEGDVSASSGGKIESTSELKTPRLDLSSGSHAITFMYFNQFESEREGALPENDIKIMFSKDGGITWEEKAIIDHRNEINVIKNLIVDLGTPASDNCYIKWVFSPLTYDAEAGYEYSIFFMDCVQLPPLYGVDKVPGAVTMLSPVNDATNIYNKNVVLTWDRTLFATGYKLYVGTDENATNLLNGIDLGDKTSYTIAKCDYATKYNWKVVPYNTIGDGTNSQIWNFSILADQTINTYPWNEGFESDGFPPLGWNTIIDGGTRWSKVNILPFDGKFSASAGCYKTESSSFLETPEFILPTAPMQISFFWGNGMPIELKIDASGLTENKTVSDDGIDAGFFEIYVDGAWKQLCIISDKTNLYWIKERVDLKEYAGKTVSFRWRYVGHNFANATGISIDNINISASTDNSASFNTKKWDAGKVNFKQSVSSFDKLSILNDGAHSLTINSVAFTKSNFSSNLQAGTVIDSKKGKQFKIEFNALETGAKVEDNMVVTFEGGYSVSLSVVGDALANDVKYYDFEKEVAGSTSPTGFTTIDVDRKSTLNMTGMNYPSYGLPFAFCVQDNSDWRNEFQPVSGTKVLIALSPNDYSTTDDWLISEKMVATNKSVFNFYGRLWNTVNSMLPENQSSLEVLVSTTSNTDINSFEVVMEKELMPYYNNKNYEKYSVDLSKYAGQEIYIALRHTVTDGLAAFFDDFSFEHFSSFSGVESIEKDGNAAFTVYPNPTASVVYFNCAEEVNAKIFNATGALVMNVEKAKEVNMSELPSGLYLISAETESGVKTVRVIKQ